MESYTTTYPCACCGCFSCFSRGTLPPSSLNLSIANLGFYFDGSYSLPLTPAGLLSNRWEAVQSGSYIYGTPPSTGNVDWVKTFIFWGPPDFIPGPMNPASCNNYSLYYLYREDYTTGIYTGGWAYYNFYGQTIGGANTACVPFDWSFSGNANYDVYAFFGSFTVNATGVVISVTE